VTEYISTKEAGDILNITPRAVRGLLSRGSIQGSKLGRDWLARRASVLEYADKREARTGRREEQSEE